MTKCNNKTYKRASVLQVCWWKPGAAEGWIPQHPRSQNLNKTASFGASKALQWQNIEDTQIDLNKLLNSRKSIYLKKHSPGNHYFVIN